MSGDAKSVFREGGFRAVIAAVHEEIQEIYLSDKTPWVIGYSGGKDSTAILQLCWNAVAELPVEKRTKPIHVISTDTLVENPVVALWVNRSLEVMADAARVQSMPIVPHRLTPKLSQSFWVNLIGRGYPAPRLKFRWCTERLKIHPSNDFIRQTVQEHGEVILVLGIRKAESSKRAATMARHGKKSVRDRLTPNASMQNSLIYTPIESWSNDDVWMYLMQVKNSWGYNNKDLLTMYQGATADGECPLVVDTNTPSCGNSRFGCWVCTLVDEDKSMTAMVQNDIEKEWMAPLLEIRNELDFRTEAARQRDQANRDMRRMTGQVKYFEDKEGRGRLIKGPYTQKARAHWLRRVLEAQRLVRERGPVEVRNWDLITLGELEEIRRIWVGEKHEVEDLLPRIYEEETGAPYPGPNAEEDPVLNDSALKVLRDITGDNELHYELVRNLLDIERQYRNRALRRGLFHDLKQAISRCFYDGEDDALERARTRAQLRDTESTDELRELAAQEGGAS
ncbi:MAG: DNA phosphorothioation system sulfurtransferase DndC [Krumholzibacteria bacterium]|nr:DNA phosphorothioation system sulfurtransferase DndC [Candidatus Krumholzibacteria bacterium]